MSHSYRVPTLAIAVALVFAMVATAPAVAQETNSSVAEDILSGEGEDNSLLDAALGFAFGLDDRVGAWFTDLSGDTPSASTLATDAQETFNEHSGDFESYANSRTTATTDADVLKVTFEQGDESVIRYVTADVTNNSYENVSMVANTDRTPDEECTLRGSAARNADDEIDRFHSEFVAPDKDVTRKYLSNMASKYGSYVGDEAVTCTFMEG